MAFIEGDIALWMGHVTFTDSQGEQTVVDKSWGYKQDQEVNCESCCITRHFLLRLDEVGEALPIGVWNTQEGLRASLCNKSRSLSAG